MAGDAGLEPTHVAVKVLCLTDLANPLESGERTGIRTPDTRLRRALLYPAELCTHIRFFLMERVKGIEPSQPAWKAGTLPLSYTRIFNLYKVVRMKGVEPPRRRRQILSLVRLPIPPHPHSLFKFGGGWWIRTTESNANRFTVCPLWPLGKSSVFMELVIGIEPTTC